MTDDHDIEMSYDVSGFVAKLRRLADALEAGTAFKIEIDGEEISVPDDALLSVEFERDGGEVEVEFQLSWREDHDEYDEEEEEDEDDEDAPVSEDDRAVKSDTPSA